MRQVNIVGVGQVAPAPHDERPFEERMAAAVRAALADAGADGVQALYATGDSTLPLSANGPLAGVTVHAASTHDSGIALYQAGLDVAAGVYDSAVVAAVCVADESVDAAALLIWPQVRAALIMRRYMYEYGWRRADFAPFVLNAHANARAIGYTPSRAPLSAQVYAESALVVDPLSEYDVATWQQGSVACVICSDEAVRLFAQQPVRITGSAAATDADDLAHRADITRLKAVELAAGSAYKQAGRVPSDIAVFEPCDQFTILAALSLEASGFCAKGESVRLARSGAIGRAGSRPMSTLGGLLVQGSLDMANGLLLVANCVQQLRGQAGASQVDDARVAMAQSIDRCGSAASVHILER